MGDYLWNAYWIGYFFAVCLVLAVVIASKDLKKPDGKSYDIIDIAIISLFWPILVVSLPVAAIIKRIEKKKKAA